MERPICVKCVNLDFLHKFQSGVEKSACWEILLTPEHSEEGEIPLRLAAKESKGKWAGLGWAEGRSAEASPQSWTLALPLNTSHPG